MSDLGTVVIVFGEALSAPESCYSLIDAGFDVVAVCRNGFPCGVRKSKHIQIIDVTPPEMNYEQCLNEISELAIKCNAAAILPLDDVGLWLLNKGRAQFSCPLVI